MSLLGPREYITRLGACLLGLIVLLVISPGIGAESATVGWWDAWRACLGIDIPTAELQARGLADGDDDGAVTVDELRMFANQARTIGFNLRFSRSLLALQVGATLALCGAVLQILLRNPLAEPYTLGIASGGALGALVAIRCGWVATFAGFSSLSLSSFVAAVGVVVIIVALSRGRARLGSNELLLSGVTLGLFCGAMMMFVTAVSDEQQTFQLIRWMMGSLDSLARESSYLLPLILPAWIVLIAHARALNQYRLGDDIAASRGVHIGRMQTVCVLATTLAVAAVVAKCGPIGFVGLVVPHLVAAVLGQDARILLPASAIVGGAFLVLCDWGAQTAMRVAGLLTDRRLAGATLPVGVVTALVGVPVFLVLLYCKKRVRAADVQST
jgi:iron complex transport system permease protein